ncbi:MAG: hypothetical protein GY811_30915 [Myxococcales bacterium]|nr:hypothetical protein [Myxococcales bacterium]
MNRRLSLLLVLSASLALACNPLEGKDVSDINACTDCHQGIEPAHPFLPEQPCTSCHGGKENGTSKKEAHIAIPGNWAEIRGEALPPAPEGFIKDFSPNQLAALDPAYLQFINPSDIRVVERTCGQCHPDNVATMPNSVMVTNAGHYFPTLYLAGLQNDTLAQYGSYPATAESCDEAEGSVCDLVTLTPSTDEEIQAAVDSEVPKQLEKVAYEHYLAKNCNTCHMAGYPRNNSPALYRSTGCASCHMLYGKDGTYKGNDPMIPKGTPVYPKTHQLTTAIPTEQCATCHFQGGRIGLTFRGIRENGFGDSKTPPNAAPINETLYGHAPGYYLSDEDTTNAYDETPPDLHFAAGMHCVDCHVGTDVHGTERVFSSSKQQVDIRCEDCHGTVRDRIVPNTDGAYETSSGRVLPQLSTREDGAIILKGRVDGEMHMVPQPADILAEGGGATESMHVAMGEDRLGFSHADKLTCDTCHTSWTLKCIGCHVSYDLRLSQIDYQTGQSSSGLTRGRRSSYSLDTVLLAKSIGGRVQSAAPSQQVQMAIIGSERFGTEDGELLLGERVDDGNGGTKVVGQFRTGDGSRTANLGFLPFFQHTTSRAPRKCSTCHRTEDTPAETTRVRGVYGYGTGEFMLQGANGVNVDGLQFLDADGNQITDWAYEGAGPVPAEARQRAIDVVIEVDRP